MILVAVASLLGYWIGLWRLLWYSCCAVRFSRLAIDRYPLCYLLILVYCTRGGSCLIPVHHAFISFNH